MEEKKWLTRKSLLRIRYIAKILAVISALVFVLSIVFGIIAIKTNLFFNLWPSDYLKITLGSLIFLSLMAYIEMLLDNFIDKSFPSPLYRLLKILYHDYES